MDGHLSLARGWTEPRLQAGSPSISKRRRVRSASLAGSVDLGWRVPPSPREAFRSISRGARGASACPNFANRIRDGRLGPPGEQCPEQNVLGMHGAHRLFQDRRGDHPLGAQLRQELPTIGSSRSVCVGYRSHPPSIGAVPPRPPIARRTGDGPLRPYKNERRAQRAWLASGRTVPVYPVRASFCDHRTERRRVDWPLHWSLCSPARGFGSGPLDPV